MDKDILGKRKKNKKTEVVILILNKGSPILAPKQLMRHRKIL